MIGGIDQQGNTSGLGHQIVEKSQPLRRNLLGEKTDPGVSAARPGKAGDQTKRYREPWNSSESRKKTALRFTPSTGATA